MAEVGRPLIQLCGELVLELDGRRSEAELPSRQGRMLFAYLVVNRFRPVGRDEAAAAVWPDSPPDAEAALARGEVDAAYGPSR
jgi:SARP family transcriptional regulator, regulator of embCAB operon